MRITIWPDHNHRYTYSLDYIYSGMIPFYKEDN